MGKRLCALLAMADHAPKDRLEHPYAPNTDPRLWHNETWPLSPRCIYLAGAQGLEGG